MSEKIKNYGLLFGFSDYLDTERMTVLVVSFFVFKYHTLEYHGVIFNTLRHFLIFSICFLSVKEKILIVWSEGLL